MLELRASRMKMVDQAPGEGRHGRGILGRRHRLFDTSVQKGIGQPGIRGVAKRQRALRPLWVTSRVLVFVSKCWVAMKVTRGGCGGTWPDVSQLQCSKCLERDVVSRRYGPELMEGRHLEGRDKMCKTS